MANGTGSATINFGAFPGTQECQVAVTGQATISATSKAEAFIMGDDTSTGHTAADHRYVGLFIALSCGTPTAGTGFTIYARAQDKLQGNWTIRWVWSD
jgi:hypothetical protein